MGFLKKIAGFLGLYAPREEETGGDERGRRGLAGERELDREVDFPELQNLPRKGFSVKAPMVVERPKLAPIIVPSENGDGGIQGFNWYREKMKMDEDGDVADEFLLELPLPVHNHSLEMAATSDLKTKRTELLHFEVNKRTRRAPVSSHARIVDGNIQHRLLEHDGSSQWSHARIVDGNIQHFLLEHDGSS